MHSWSAHVRRSGTAFLGGVLIDAYGYGIAFHVTALVQLLGVLVRASPASEQHVGRSA